MIRKITFLLVANAILAFGLKAQDSSGVVNGNNCQVAFRAIVLTGAPNTVNFYTDSVFSDPAINAIPEWYWDFGDGEFSNEINPVHTYDPNISNSYTVTLTVVLGDFCKSSYSEVVYLGGVKACTSSFYWYLNDSIKFVTEAYAVSFVDKSWSSDSEVTEWLWDFGDGQTSPEQNPMHTYQPMNMSPMPPDFMVTLTIKTTSGCVSSFTQMVSLKQIYIPECQAYFYYEPAIDIITIPEVVPIQFYDKSFANVTNRLWDFGDGTTSTEASPVHNYDFLNGPYIATLTITTDTGCVSTYSDYIRTGTSNGECRAMFYYKKPDTLYNIETLVTYQFIDASEGDIIKRTWDFGDGTMSNEKEPSHSFYFQGGYFMVSLTTVTSSGCESYYSEYIWVGDPIIWPIDTCPYYINVITGENPLQDNLCNGTATASLFDYNGMQIDIDKFYWSNGEEGISTGNLCYNNYYRVKTVTASGCSVYSDFTLYNKEYLDSGMIDPTVDWSSFNDSLYYYFNYLYEMDSAWICVWDFGDGQTAEGPNVSHEYSDNGYYNITLTIIDSTGAKVFSKAMEVNKATSVKKTSASPSYSIYPNPVSDLLTISIKTGKPGEMTVAVIDVTGKIRMNETFGTVSTNTLRIPVKELPSGIYFAKIARNGENPEIIKFVK
jgi:PKD repeat protein